jgi:hypothetical protein
MFTVIAAFKLGLFERLLVWLCLAFLTCFGHCFFFGMGWALPGQGLDW